MYMASGKSETNAYNGGFRYRSQFVVLELSCPNSNHVFASKLSSANTSFLIILMVSKGTNAAISKACSRLIPGSIFLLRVNRGPGYETTLQCT